MFLRGDDGREDAPVAASCDSGSHFRDCHVFFEYWSVLGLNFYFIRWCVNTF